MQVQHNLTSIGSLLNSFWLFKSRMWSTKVEWNRSIILFDSGCCELMKWILILSNSNNSLMIEFYWILNSHLLYEIICSGIQWWEKYFIKLFATSIACEESNFYAYAYFEKESIIVKNFCFSNAILSMCKIWNGLDAVGVMLYLNFKGFLSYFVNWHISQLFM